MDINGLINYLRLEGSHDLECIPIASEEDAPPPGNELSDEEGDSKEERVNLIEAGLMEEADPEEDPSGRELAEEEDSEKDPGCCNIKL